MLLRLLAALSAHGVFARTNEGFRHNELSRVLRSRVLKARVPAVESANKIVSSRPASYVLSLRNA